MNRLEMPLLKITFNCKGENLNFQDISDTLRIMPTRTRVKNSFPPLSRTVGVASDVWEYSIEKQSARSLSEMIDGIAVLLGDKAAELNYLREKYHAEYIMAVVIHSYMMQSPTMILTRKDIEFLHDIHCIIDIDVYQYENKQ